MSSLETESAFINDLLPAQHRFSWELLRTNSKYASSYLTSHTQNSYFWIYYSCLTALVTTFYIITIIHAFPHQWKPYNLQKLVNLVGLDVSLLDLKNDPTFFFFLSWIRPSWHRGKINCYKDENTFVFPRSWKVDSNYPTIDKVVQISTALKVYSSTMQNTH